MPVKPENRHRYPADWAAISLRIRAREKNRCKFCGARNHEPNPETGSRVVLTVAHLNQIPEDCREENLAALCQRCHLRYDALDRAKLIEEGLERRRAEVLHG